MARLFCSKDSIGQECIIINDPGQVHYICDVLRLGIGEDICVFDGQGGEYDCQIQELSRKAAKLIINKDFKMTQERGIWFQTTGYAPFCMAVLHPAYVLRQEGESFEKSRGLLSADIAEVKDKLQELGEK